MKFPKFDIDSADSLPAFFKVTIAWVLGLIGSITLSDAVMLTTLFYTALQSYFLIRNNRRKKAEKLDECQRCGGGA